MNVPLESTAGALGASVLGPMEFALSALPGLVALIFVWVLLRRVFTRIGRHIDRTEAHQMRVEKALDELLRQRSE